MNERDKWKDFNNDGKVDFFEEMIAEEMLCTSKEEHIALFGNADSWEDEDDDDTDLIDDYDIDLNDDDDDNYYDIDLNFDSDFDCDCD